MLKREFIPIGKENAISRRDLCRMAGMNDREVRREIARLRVEDDGSDMVIVSASRGRGYYRTDCVEDIVGFIAEMTARISSIVEAIKHAKAVVERLRKKQMYGEGLG
jgi:hypothetical protein